MLDSGIVTEADELPIRDKIYMDFAKVEGLNVKRIGQVVFVWENDIYPEDNVERVHSDLHETLINKVWPVARSKHRMIFPIVREKVSKTLEGYDYLPFPRILVYSPEPDGMANGYKSEEWVYVTVIPASLRGFIEEYLLWLGQHPDNEENFRYIRDLWMGVEVMNGCVDSPVLPVISLNSN